MAIHISDLGNGHKIIENDEEYEKRTKVGCGSILVILLIVIGIAFFNDDKNEGEECSTINDSFSETTLTDNPSGIEVNISINENADYHNIDNDSCCHIKTDNTSTIFDNEKETVQDDDVIEEAVQNEDLKEEIQQEEERPIEIIQTLNLWTLYHNIKDVKSLCSLYADKVYYYQSDYSKEQIRSSKKKLMKKYPRFKQEISNVKIEPLSNQFKITFDKTVWTETEENPEVYPSYLYMEMIDGKWKIITESDLITDASLDKK